MAIKTLSRRGFIKYTGLGALAGVFLGFSAWSYATQVEPRWIDITEIHLPLRRLPPSFNGLRVVQLSDIHIGGWMNRARLDQVVEQILALKPDVVTLTGDYLAGHGWTKRHAALLEDLEVSLRPLSKASTVVGILGNHDHWTSARGVRTMFARAGIADLSNTFITLRRGEECLYLAGVDDLYERRAQLPELLKRLPSGGSVILLAHEPDYAVVSAATGRFDLQLSGHTHGGQVVVPFYGPPILPHLGKKYPSGRYQVKEMIQYTNRGIGMGSLPVRFNCRPEISVFVLRPGEI